MTDLTGKVAIVTGASAPHGIGRATALKLAELGAAVVVTDTEQWLPRLEELSQTIETDGGRALAMAVDVTQREQIDACVSRTCGAFEGVDILVNNAGTTAGALPFLEITEADWNASFRVNLKGPADFCQAVIPMMKDAGGGAIVNIGSTASLGAEPGFGAYTATKHGLVGLTKTIAAEFGPDGIRCNAVCPGFVMTDMHIAANERIAAREGRDPTVVAADRYSGVALRRAATPEEVAEVVAHLASPAASYITGVALPVAGGSSVGL
ncbi:MAG: SDR family NAD(P)-dependent oxidoreductase [Pseudomonadota bacterium]